MYSDIGLICWSILAMMAEFEWVSMPVPQGRANLLPFDLWQIFINVKFSLNNLSCCSCCSGSGPQRACWHGRQDVFGEVWFQGGIFCRGKFGCFGLILFDIGILFHLIAACLLVNSGNKSKPWSSFQAFRGAWDVWWHVMIFWYTTQLLVLADNESRFGNFYFAPATTTLPGHDDWIESCHCAEVLTIALTAPLPEKECGYLGGMLDGNDPCFSSCQFASSPVAIIVHMYRKCLLKKIMYIAGWEQRYILVGLKIRIPQISGNDLFF